VTRIHAGVTSAKASASLICSESTLMLLMLYYAYAHNAPQLYVLAGICVPVIAAAWMENRPNAASAAAAPKTRARKAA
jgi:hypothetical protein